MNISFTGYISSPRGGAVKFFAFAVLILVSVFAFTGVANATTLNVSSDVTSVTYRNAVVKAADRLVATQNTDGGWDWQNPDSNPATGSEKNTLGVTAEILVDAYRLTHNQNYLTTANKTFDLLKANSLVAGFKLRGPDISFLVDLSSVTSDSQYVDFAKTEWANDKANFGTGGTATSFGNYVRDLRHSQNWDGLIPWDINLYVQGVKKLADYTSDPAYGTDAVALAQVIFDDASSTPPLFDMYDPTERGYLFGLTGMLSAISSVNISTAITSGDISTKLLSFNNSGAFINLQDTAAQGSSPTVDDHLTTVQTSAYAAVALKQAGSEFNDSMVTTLAYLLAQQDSTSGAWKDGVAENTEVNSESGVSLARNIVAMNTYYSIQDAVNAATSGNTINVAAGTYTESPTISKALNLQGSVSATVNGKITVAHDNVTISGLTVTNPTDGYGIYVNNVNHIAITNNTLTNIGTDSSYTHGSAQGIYVQGSGAGASDIGISNNTISNIGNLSLAYSDVPGSGTSAKGIYIGDSNGTNAISGVVIDHNTISNVFASTAAWPTGRGAYGILINHATSGAGSTVVSITNNTISGNLQGLWSTAIGLEGNTPGALVENNSISGLTSATNLGVHVESNANAATVNIRGNQFSLNLSAGILNSTIATTTATNNWWGTASSTIVATKVSGPVNYTPWYINPGRTVLNTALGDSGSVITTSAPTIDFAETTDGAVELPEGTSNIQMGDNTVLDFSANANTKSGDDIVIAGVPTTMSTFTLGDATTVVNLSTPQTVGGATVSVEKVVKLSSGSTTAPIVITNTALPNVEASIPDDTTILAPSGWTGTIQPPKAATGSGDAPSGFSVGSTVIEVGSPTAVLLFDKPVTITLHNVAGEVGYKPAGTGTSWVRITNSCGDYNNPTAPAFPGECAISNGTDTKILTYHFTTFGSLTATPAPAPSSGGGGGGGGGIVGLYGTVNTNNYPGITPTQQAAAAAAAAPAAQPVAGQVLGAATYNFGLALALGSVGDEVTELQKRLQAEGVYSGPVTGYFGSLTSEAVKKFQEKHGISPVGVVGPQTRNKLNSASAVVVPGCEGGNKFNTITGKSCVASATLGAAVSAFVRSLQQGSTGDEVTKLQERLTTEGVYSGPVTGYFGALTKEAVKKYQEKYGIIQTGFVGPLTRTQLNK